MDEASRKFLQELLETPSPSGFEARGQRLWIEHTRARADEVSTDTYGTAWARLEGTAGERPLVMLEAHADEIGYMIRHVTEEGFLRVTRIGGIDRASSRGKRVRILGDRGPVEGVIGNTAVHIRDRDEKVPEYHELFVDVGAADAAAVAELGLRVGHPMVFADGAGELFPGRLTGRALDNRIGGFIVARVIELLGEGERPGARVVAVNSVQEEIGGHGARMATYRLEPDLAICLDVTHATDTPGIDKARHGDIKLGGGPSLTHGKANHPAVVQRLIEVAAGAEIPLQHEAVSHLTGTDTDDIFHSRSGVPSALVSLPMRYMHSTIETVSLEDVERCIELLAGLVRSVRPGERFAVEP